MAVTPPPRKTSVVAQDSSAQNTGDKKIDAIINRGSTSVKASPQEPKIIKNFNIKITAMMLGKIDEARAKRPRKPTSPKLGISTQDWLTEAIAEKLEREQKRFKLGSF